MRAAANQHHAGWVEIADRFWPYPFPSFSKGFMRTSVWTWHGEHLPEPLATNGQKTFGSSPGFDQPWLTPPVYAPSRPLRYSSRTLCAKRMSLTLAFPIFGSASRQVCFARGMTSSSNTLEALARVSGFWVNSWAARITNWGRRLISGWVQYIAPSSGSSG